MPVTTTIPWEDGSGDNLYFTCDALEGDQTVQVSSDANTGTERTKTVTFSASGVEPKSLGIIQLSGGSTREFDDWLKDSDTHLWIDIVNDYQKSQQIRIRMIGTIDWGDGSTAESVSVTTYTTFSHTYADKGRYRIDLHPTSGTFYLGGSSSSYNVMGSRSDSTLYRTSALYQVEIGSGRITTLSSYAFYYCYGLRKVYIAQNIVSAGQQVFAFCYSLKQIEFEDVTKLATATSTNFFTYCYALQDIGGFAPDWGETISTTIRNCYCLTEFSISSGVTSITANSLGNTAGLKNLYVYAQTPPSVANSNAFTGFNTNCVIHVPNGKLATYQAASVWKTYKDQMVEMPATP